MSNSYKIIPAFFFILLTVFVPLESGMAQPRIQVKPKLVSISLEPGQMETKFFEVQNREKNYVSVKTEYDTNWISVYPSKFILLPAGTKRVMAIFSLRHQSNPVQRGKIVFRSKNGIEQSVTVQVGTVSPPVSTGPEVNPTLPVAEKGQPTPVVPALSGLDSTPVTKPRPKTGISPGPRLAEPEKKNPSEIHSGQLFPPQQPLKSQSYPPEYQQLVDSLQTVIRELEAKLKQTEAEAALLREKIQQQNKKIAHLGSQLTDDMIAELKELFNFSRKYFDQEVKEHTVRLAWGGDRFSILIDGKTGFASGSIRLAPDGREILTKVASLAKTRGKYEKVISVRGHTDSIPIKRSYRDKIPSNWELSALRAATVVRTLEQEMGVSGKNLSLSAFSFYRPIADNRTAEGRRKNRRIEIIFACRTQETELFVNAGEKGN